MIDTLNKQQIEFANYMQEYDLSHDIDLRFSSPKLMLHGMLDGSITSPLPHVPTIHSASQPNPGYVYWLRVGQLVRAWLFATISKDTLSEVCDCYILSRFSND